MLGVALLIAVISILCFTTAGRWVAEDAADNLDESIEKTRVWWRQFWCGLRGHGEMMRHFQNGRLSVRCDRCWAVSPGVEFAPGVRKGEGR